MLNMPAFIDAKNLQPFINEDLGGVLNPIEYQGLKRNMATGYDAKILPLLCDVYLSVRADNQLTVSQLPLAVISDKNIIIYSK